MWFDELNGHKDMPIQPGGTPVPPQALTEGEGLRGLKTRLSIATFVILSLVFVATLLLVGMALFNNVQESARGREKLKRETVTNVDQLAAGLSLPLWNFDYSQVAKILDSAMQDENAHGLVVTQSDPANAGNVVTYVRARGPAWQVVAKDPDASGAGLLTEERQITAMGEPIGSVKLIVTTKFLEQEMRQRLTSAIVLSLLIDLLLIVSLYLLLWRVVLKPLRSIERYALAVKAGGITALRWSTHAF